MKSRHLESREIPVAQPGTAPEWDQYWRWRHGATSVDAWAAWSASAARTRAIMASTSAPRTPVAVPEGWQLVPIEPSDAMLDAAARAGMQHLLDCIHDPAKIKEMGSERMVRLTHGSRYRSMLAAAPTPHAEGGE